MTIDEAIKRAEEVASDYDILAEQSVLKQNKHHHHKCAAEHRQLAKWLKDYKRLKEQEHILDKERAEVINRYPKNYAGEPELNGNACEFSLNQILQIIDKYKAEMESEEND